MLRHINWVLGGVLQRTSRGTRRLLKPMLGTRRAPLARGMVAPEFSLASSDGGQVRLADFRGKNAVLLVFYPGDHTPICTRQLCEVRDLGSRLAERGIVAFGVNPAPASMHESFRSAYQLPFPLLIDDRLEVAGRYHARLGVLTRRTVVLIDPQGRIAFFEHGNPPLDEVIASLP
jgi:peroxiredoxin Q/BCP